MSHSVAERRRLARVGRALGLTMDGRWSVSRMSHMIREEVFGPPPPTFQAGDTIFEGVIVRTVSDEAFRAMAQKASRLAAAERAASLTA